MTLSDNTRGILFMCGSMAGFTLNDIAMKALTQEMPLFQAIFLRGCLATLGLLIIARISAGTFNLIPPRGDRMPVLLRTLGEVGSTALFLVALTHMPLANLSAIMQSLPLAVTLTAALVFKDQIGWRRMAAILVGFAGVMIIIRPGAASFDEWSLMGLASVGCVVVRDLATRQFSRAMPSAVPAVWAAVAVLAMGGLGMAFQGAIRPSVGQLALVATAGAFLMGGYMMAIKTMRVGDLGLVAPFRYTSLLWAILGGWVIFGTLPDGMTLLGSAIVVGSGIYMLLRERQVRAAAR